MGLAPVSPISIAEYEMRATLVWLHAPYDRTAASEVCDEFTLAEAVRFVMESLDPGSRPTARISIARRDFSPDEIAAIHRRSDFPRS
jgi:hypothetical protein